MTDGSRETSVRRATDGDRDAVVELLDAAMLEADGDRIRRRIERGDVLVADAGDRTVGVCVLDPRDEATEITQVAVRRSRRARGVGRELVEAAAARADGPLTATFRAQVRPFYESLGFEIREVDEWRDGDVGTGDDADADDNGGGGAADDDASAGDSGGAADGGDAGDSHGDRTRFRGVLR